MAPPRGAKKATLRPRSPRGCERERVDPRNAKKQGVDREGREEARKRLAPGRASCRSVQRFYWPQKGARGAKKKLCSGRDRPVAASVSEWIRGTRKNKELTAKDAKRRESDWPRDARHADPSRDFIGRKKAQEAQKKLCSRRDSPVAASVSEWIRIAAYWNEVGGNRDGREALPAGFFFGPTAPLCDFSQNDFSAVPRASPSLCTLCTPWSKASLPSSHV